MASLSHNAPQPQGMPIPDALNLGLVVAVSSLSIGLLWAASRLERPYAVLGVGMVFSYVLLTNYALLHEAAHDNLSSNPRVNYLLGVTAGALFPVAFSMVRATHQGHHLRNRTDYEMFDLYYPTDNLFKKYLQWYGTLCGLFWPWIPIGALLFALCPPLLRVPAVRNAKTASYLVGDVRGAEVRRIRLEAVLVVALFLALFRVLDLRWQAVLALYACFAFNWSTRQYVGHAFSRRDVVEGAWNLRHSRWMNWVLLYGNWDLNHHRNPGVPWLYLPSLPDGGGAQPRYIAQYRRMWRGPRPATEPAPESLTELPLSIHR
ncbi:MAG: fatty acid desaturase [Acidobacteria bacterium]|nr:MAG: fatty acid desaturase [Acidobacteriota bacterium]